jgi:hypothetical protein
VETYFVGDSVEKGNSGNGKAGRQGVVEIRHDVEERVVRVPLKDKVCVHVHAAIGDLRQSICGGSHDAIIAACSAQCPKEVFILGSRSLNKVASRSNDLHLFK